MSVNVYIVNRSTKMVYQVKVGAKLDNAIKTSSDIAASFDPLSASVPCTGLTLTSAPGTAIEIDGTTVITATTAPEGCTDPVFWSLDDKSVAAIAPSGATCTVTGLANGAVTVTASCGAHSQSAFITVGARFVSFTAQPEDMSVMIGNISGSLTAQASASDGSALSYQWYSNTTDSNEGGTLIVGETSASMALSTTLAVGSYYYYCMATSQTAGSATSNVATVTVTAVQFIESLRTRIPRG